MTLLKVFLPFIAWHGSWASRCILSLNQMRICNIQSFLLQLRFWAVGQQVQKFFLLWRKLKNIISIPSQISSYAEITWRKIQAIAVTYSQLWVKNNLISDRFITLWFKSSFNWESKLGKQKSLLLEAVK